MKKIRVGIFGASGKMGREIQNILATSGELEASVGVSPSPKVDGFKVFSRDLEESLASEADLWIDFSLPPGFEKILSSCVRWKKPLVSGTTGLNSNQKNQLQEAGKVIPVLWSSNMSLGVVALKKAMNALGGLNGFDFQIEEIHHNKKIDKPSGTAITLQEHLQSVIGPHPLPEPISMRGGAVVGIHKVWAFSQEEMLCFEHQALSRSVFAKGATWAAQQLILRPPGLYTLEDLIRWP